MVDDEQNQPVKSVFCPNCGFAGKGAPGDECPDCHTHLISDPAAEEMDDEMGAPAPRFVEGDDEDGGLPFGNEMVDDIPDDRKDLE